MEKELSSENKLLAQFLKDNNLSLIGETKLIHVNPDVEKAFDIISKAIGVRTVSTATAVKNPEPTPVENTTKENA